MQKSKNASAKLSTINFSKIESKVKNFEVKVTSNKKSTLYIYPESFTSKDINEVKGKNFRGGLRRKITNFSNNILSFSKQKNAELLLNEIQSFEIFYKENYKVNDFSLQSISQKKENTEDIVTMLEIIKDIKGQMISTKKVSAKKEVAKKEEVKL